MRCTYPTLQLKNWVCLGQFVSLCPCTIYSFWQPLSNFYSYLERPVGYIFWEKTSSLSLSLKSLYLLPCYTTAEALIAQIVFRFDIFCTAAFYALTGRKSASLYLQQLDSSLMLPCCLYITLFIHWNKRNTTWNFQKSKNWALLFSSLKF